MKEINSAINSIFFFVFCLSPLSVGAQSFTVSEEIPLRSDLAYELIGELRGRVLLFRDRVTDFEIQAFDQNMKSSWEKKIELDKRLPKVVGITSTRDYFNVFYRFRDKTHTLLKIHKYDPAANLIDSITIKDFGYIFYTPNLEIVQSEDKTKVLFFYLERQSIFNVISFDIEKMSVLWEKTFEPENFNFYQEYRQMLVDNDGNMHLVLEKDNFKAKRKDHYFEIYACYGNPGNFVQYKIPMLGMLTYDVSFTFDNLNKRLVGGGLHSENSMVRAEGYFYLNIDPENPQEYLLSFEGFESEFLSNLLGKSVDNNKGLAETTVQEPVLRKDGGILLIGERTRQLERRIAGASRVVYDGVSRYIVDYYYDEFFIISIHPDGKTHWKTILHKRQYSQDDDAAYSSYFLFKSPSNLRFLFNDEIKPENTVSEYVLDGTGKFERNSLLSTEKLQLRLRFREAVQVSATQAVIPSERRNRLRLVKLEY
jgi:hypothetical protein